MRDWCNRGATTRFRWASHLDQKDGKKMVLANVSEIYPLYDSVIISQRLWGNEIKVKGWFGGHAGDPWAKPWEQFGDTPEHLFFKDRTEGNSDLAYCNLQSAETMDFAYRLYSIGVRFWGPISSFEVSPRYAYNGDGMPPWGAITNDDPYILASAWKQFFATELPQHVGFEFKVEQDVICEGPAMTFPPGHGFIGGGSSWSDPVTPGDSNISTTYDQNFEVDAQGEDSLVQYPQHISVVNQGVPGISNRFNFVNAKGFPQPVEIPKNALIQAKIILSPYVQEMMNDVLGPLYYLFNRRCPRAWGIGATPDVNESPATWFGTRYGITVSMLGERLVQQRGQYFAPGTSGE